MNDSDRQSSPAYTELAKSLMSLDGVADPYQDYARLHAQGGICEVAPGEFYVGGYDDCLAVLTQPNTFRSPGDANAEHSDDGGALGLLKRLMNAQNAPSHTRMRRAVVSAFTRRQMYRIKDDLEIICDELVADISTRMRNGAVVDVHNELSTAFPLLVLLKILGIPRDEGLALAELISIIFAAGGPAPTPEQVERADRATTQLTNHVTVLADRKRRKPADDVLTRVVTASENGELSESEMSAMIAGQIIAGYETTAAGIDTALLLIAKTSQRIRPGEFGRFADEVLRYDAPVQFTPQPRVVCGDASLGNVKFPDGARIWPVLGAANRDPRVFSAPDRFDVSRDEGKSLSFGAGMHHCLGVHLARLEISIALERMQDQVPGWRLVSPPIRRYTRQLRAFESINITYDERDSA